MVSYSEMEQAVAKVLEAKLTSVAGLPLKTFTDDVCALLNVTDKWDRMTVAARAKGVAECDAGKYLVCGSKIYSRQLFFSHTQFRVVPTSFELEHGVLLIGADFAPFCPLSDIDRGLLPSDVQLFFADGTPAKPLRIEADYPEVENVYYMLGKSEMIDVFSGEDESNRVSMMNASTFADVHLVMPGFNMEAFYREHHFRDGDALIVEVLDWSECRYSVRMQPHESAPDENCKNKFVRILERALTVESEMGLESNGISDQIATAYMLALEAGDDLRFSPWVSVSEYQFRMCDIQICTGDSEWVLEPIGDDECGEGCHCHDHDLPEGMSMDPDISPDGFSISTATTSSLIDILRDLNAPLNATEITAMVFSDFSSGNDNEEIFYANLIELMKLDFVDEGQEVVFHNDIDELWEQCYEIYTPMADEGRSELRDRLLEIVNDRISVAKDLQMQYDGRQVPKGIVNKMEQVRKKTTETLTLLLNPQYEIEVGNGLYTQILTRVNNIEDEWDRFTESLELE